MAPLIALVLATTIGAGQQEEKFGLLQRAQIVLGQKIVEGKVTALGRADRLNEEFFEKRYGEQLVHCEGSAIVARNRESGRQSWKFQTPDGQFPQILASDAESIYVASVSSKQGVIANNPAVWVVASETGRLKAKLSLPKLVPPWTIQSVASVLVTKDGIAVFVRATQTDYAYDWEKPLQARLYFYSF
ncbi:MAG: hypothetical protein JSS72_11300 [Armatimonadetes bacterium]|nr:hypothetical protein [Armatimonadota bacterium]